MRPKASSAKKELAAVADLAAAAGDGAALQEIISRLDKVAHKLIEAEEENARQAQVLAQIHESVITMDLAGYITSWNKSAELLFGYSAEEAIGRNILILYANESENDEQGHDEFLEHGGREMEVRRRRKSGEVFWASLSLSTMHDADGTPSGLIGYLSDITERLAAAEILRLHATIFANNEEGILISDANRRIISVNRAFCSISGYAEEELIGQPLNMFECPPQDEDFYRAVWETVANEGNWRGETLQRRADGTSYPQWASLSAVNNTQGRLTHYFFICSDISERKRAEERIHYLAYYDSLTGLPNRSLLHRLLGQALAEAQRGGQHGAVLFIDLNRFKPINDTLGHDVGDRLLAQVGERFRATLRGEDVMSRLGGDEFVAALFDIGRREDAGRVAQKLIDSLDDPFLIDSYELRLGASIGISIYPQDSLVAENLLRYADVAMYRAKQTGQSGYMFYSEEMNQRSLDRLKIENGLRLALERGELMVHYQPKTDMARSRVIGAEALVRWRHPDNGMISPGDFIPVAEDSGLVVQIGEWVLEQACRDALAWRSAGLPTIKIAVNISAKQLSGRLPSIVAAVLARHGLDSGSIELELTESMLMHGSDAVITMMDELHDMGIALALDDFGTGYSSLSYLKRFPIDTLKIDRSFVSGIPGDPSDCAIAGAIVSMAKQLGHKVIAEGVETEAQLAFLERIGCDEIQGFLFSPALPAHEFAEMLKGSARPLKKP